MLALVSVLYLVSILVAVIRHINWEDYKAEHHCVIIETIEETNHTQKNHYQCDDGKKYWRTEKR